MAQFSLSYAIEKFPEMLSAVPMTLLVAVVSILIGLILGLGLALCKIYKVFLLNRIAIVFVSFMRGTPALVQIYVIFYGIPALIEFLNTRFGWRLNPLGTPPIVYAFIAFSLNSAAYQSEIIRSALLSVDVGQMEAAHSIGMNASQSFWRIIIPQALVVAIPNFGNNFIGLIKATSLAFSVKVMEIMAVAKIIGGDGYRYLEMYLDASLIYWVICFFFERIFALAEKTLSKHERKMNVGTAS